MMDGEGVVVVYLAGDLGDEGCFSFFVGWSFMGDLYLVFMCGVYISFLSGCFFFFFEARFFIERAWVVEVRRYRWLGGMNGGR